MTTFTRIGNRLVNLDFVKEFRTRRPERGDQTQATRHIAYGADGEELGLLSFTIDPERLEGTIVPAGYLMHAVVIECGYTEERPTDADMVEESLPVVAWHVIDGVAEPIFAERPGVAALVALPMGEKGAWHVPYEASGLSLETLRAMVLARAQAAWDRWNEKPSDE